MNHLVSPYYCTSSLGKQICESVTVQLTDEEIKVENQYKHLVIRADDILNISILEGSDSQNSLPTNIDFVIDFLPKVSKTKLWAKPHRQLTFYRFWNSSLDSKDEWIKALMKLCKFAKKRQMIALVNHKSGRGKAKQYLKKITPIFAKSNIHVCIAEIRDSNILYGETQQSFSSFFQSLDLTKIDGIIVCGGDGTVHSIVNALMNRSDWLEAIKTPIGILPCGTGNGLCKTVLELSDEPYSLTSAAFLIAKGTMRDIDIFKIHQETQTFYGVHSLAWGLVSDIDIKSNNLRFLGLLKELIYGLAYILKCRIYSGELDFAPHLVFKSVSTIPMNTRKDLFIGIWAVNIPWTSPERFSAPLAKIDDGFIDLLVLRQGISRKKLLEIFLKTEDGSHIYCENIEYYKTQSLILKPLEKSGTMAVDGEPIASTQIKLEVLHKLCFLFCR